LEKRKRLSGLDTAVAVILALIWLSGGLAGLVLGFMHGRWLLVFISPFALIYSRAWVAVAIRGQLLTWKKVVAPWRQG
jgi:hypothetical protein